MAISNRFHAICKACSRMFSLDSSQSEYCAQCSTSQKLQKDCQPNMTCTKCNGKFYSPNHLRKCPFCSVKKYSMGTIKQKTYDNEKIVEKKKRRSISLDELIRRQEYKRVMDDSGWDHYLRGNKWDKI